MKLFTPTSALLTLTLLATTSLSLPLTEQHLEHETTTKTTSQEAGFQVTAETGRTQPPVQEIDPITGKVKKHRVRRIMNGLQNSIVSTVTAPIHMVFHPIATFNSLIHPIRTTKQIIASERAKIQQDRLQGGVEVAADVATMIAGGVSANSAISKAGGLKNMGVANVKAGASSALQNTKSLASEIGSVIKSKLPGGKKTAPPGVIVRGASAGEGMMMAEGSSVASSGGAATGAASAGASAMTEGGMAGAAANTVSTTPRLTAIKSSVKNTLSGIGSVVLHPFKTLGKIKNSIKNNPKQAAQNGAIVAGTGAIAKQTFPQDGSSTTSTTSSDHTKVVDKKSKKGGEQFHIDNDSELDAFLKST